MTPFGEEIPKRDPWNGRNPEDDPVFRSKMPAKRPPRVDPWPQSDIDSAFCDLVAELADVRGASATASPLMASRRERINLSDLDEPLTVDLQLGLTSCEFVALCQLCITGLSAVQRRRLCHHCLRIDRKLAAKFGGARFLPTTRRPSKTDRCVTIHRTVGQIPAHQRTPRARALEQYLWQQMDETFQANLRLLTMLGGFDESQPVAYDDWAARFLPGQARSLDAYLSYAQLHLPWALGGIHELIEELEVGAE